jgi:hypothetical protein
MPNMSTVLSQDEGHDTARAANCPVLAPIAMGINIVRKLTPVQANYTFAMVIVEYFIKWIEVKSLTNVSSASIKKFFWRNIICRYGIPKHITVDNAKYFDNAMFKDFC